MNVGYVRLSKDDDRQNYISIENQKLIIEQYAAKENFTIDRWYEDDGVSGYKFNRPAFSQMLTDLDTDIDVVVAKDLSRIGRHNANVLLFLDMFREKEKRLIVIDDNYDTLKPDDDVIGIKTWYNERYVKDTSKKIKSALLARQKEGTLLIGLPLGYIRNAKDKHKIEIVPQEAEYVKLIFNLYLQGNGYRRIGFYLNEHNIPTPSMIMRERKLAEGKISKRTLATKWGDSMVKDILKNDTYIGTYRQHKRARATVHGKDKRVPKEQQYIFENHHEAIIDKLTFDLVQEIMEKRIRSNYRGNKGIWSESEIPNPFGSTLYCKDCGSRLTPIVRKTTARTRKYYICTTYNTKGKQYCSKSHTIEENELMNDVITYIKLCRDALSEMIATYDLKDFESEKQTVETKRLDLENTITNLRGELKTMLAQKVKDLSTNSDNSDIINESYSSIQNDLLAKINGFELQLKELDDTKLDNTNVQEKLETALEVVDNIIDKGTLDRRDVETLVDKIIVDKNGLPEIQLKYGLSGFVHYSPAEELNKYENQIIYNVMKLIHDDDRTYTSAKYLSSHLTDLGYPKSKKSILPYIGYLTKEGILEPTDNKLKPYNIVLSKADLKKRMQHLHDSTVDRRHATNDT